MTEPQQGGQAGAGWINKGDSNATGTLTDGNGSAWSRELGRLWDGLHDCDWESGWLREAGVKGASREV